MSSDKKKSKRRKDEYTGPGGNEDVADKSPPKDEIRVAKWMKKNLTTKKTKFLNHNVEYFTSSKALDALLTTSFAQGDDALFSTRDEAIQFLDSMLVHKFFHRAKKVPVSEAELRRGKRPANKEAAAAQVVDKTASAEKETDAGGAGDDSPTAASTELRKRNKSSAAGGASGTERGGAGDSEADANKSPKTPGGSDKKLDQAEKKKRKIRLDMHPDQQFVDGAEAYIWIYDPIPVHYWLIGTLLVIGAIVVCLFPLWPPTLRLGVYYLSIAAAGFLVFILVLTLLRFVVFCIVWVLTGSRHHFWLFPNLTEDVGFFASFWPLYQHDYVEGSKKGGDSKGDRGRKAKKDKLSDAEDEKTVASKVKESEPLLLVEDKGKAKKTDAEVDDIDELENNGARTNSDSESECSQKSSTSKDFEMVNSDEVDMPEA